MLFCFALHHGQSASQKGTCTGLVVKLLATEVINSMGHQAILCLTSLCTSSDWMLTLPIGWMAAAGREPCQICCGMKLEKCIGAALGQLLGIPQAR